MKNIIIILKSIFTTIFYSIKIINLSSKNQLSINAMNNLLQAWSHKILNIVNVKLNIFGQEPNLENGKKYIILCTHSSHYDIPITFQALPNTNIRMMAKKELFKIPFFGKAMQCGDFVSIDRKNIRQAGKDLKNAEQIMKKKGIVLWVAPEGTRSLDGNLQEFQKGAFYLAKKMDAIIIPLVIQGSFNVLPAKSYKFKTNQEVNVYIGDEVENNKAKDREELMKEIKKIMLTLQNKFKKEEVINEK